ncbi:zwei Ig domain protein zig-8-like isoform X1 [Penaeus monodon]|uniref:zwei Ig domain protein zig-8-like isoform X1 n=1 Tax=Penaeus monodon TaxID=6687 RepID=UPI0018A747B7|nr:zwei Ig domain protein zig-8-like isoform X1 [Penaeus monodon]
MLTNHTAYVGRQAELHCRVHSIGNRTVSWIRGRDLRILAVGRYTYTTDLRYEALHQAGTNQWTLRIKSVQPRDQGHYECQISTKPVKAFNTFLTVLEPRIEILGSPDLYVHKASMINLTCILHNLPEPPAYVLWYHSNTFHSNRNISYSSTRGGVSLIVEKGPTTISHLLIQSARVEDAGVYTCVPSNHNATSVTLHVLNGEEPAAMHKNSSLPHTRPGKIFLLVVFTSVFCFLFFSFWFTFVLFWMILFLFVLFLFLGHFLLLLIFPFLVQVLLYLSLFLYSSVGVFL